MNGRRPRKQPQSAQQTQKGTRKPGPKPSNPPRQEDPAAQPAPGRSPHRVQAKAKGREADRLPAQNHQTTQLTGRKQTEATAKVETGGSREARGTSSTRPWTTSSKEGRPPQWQDKHHRTAPRLGRGAHRSTDTHREQDPGEHAAKTGDGRQAKTGPDRTTRQKRQDHLKPARTRTPQERDQPSNRQGAHKPGHRHQERDRGRQAKHTPELAQKPQHSQQNQGGTAGGQAEPAASQETSSDQKQPWTRQPRNTEHQGPTQARTRPDADQGQTGQKGRQPQKGPTMEELWGNGGKPEAQNQPKKTQQNQAGKRRHPTRGEPSPGREQRAKAGPGVHARAWPKPQARHARTPRDRTGKDAGPKKVTNRRRQAHRSRKAQAAPHPGTSLA